MEWIDVWLGIWRVETPVQVVVRVEWLVLDFVVRFWSLIYGRPLTLTGLPRRGEGTIVALWAPPPHCEGRGDSTIGCRSIAASLFGFARAKLVILFSYKIQRRRCRQTIGRPGGYW